MKLLLALILVSVVCLKAATLGTFRTPVGSWEVEFFDEDKPVTVSNFLKYATSGRYQNQFIHRWSLSGGRGFVVQGGGWRVDTNAQWEIVRVNSYGAITNEYNVGRTFSNTYGTIAMARQARNTNSASSEWFFNLADNAFLDAVDGGFTVFGKVTAGTNALNLFVPPPPANGILQDTSVFPELPVLSTNLTFDDLIYVDVQLRREMDLRVTKGSGSESQIRWTSVAGVTNVLEFSATITGTNWVALTNIVGTGSEVQASDPSKEQARIYRVKVSY